MEFQAWRRDPVHDAAYQRVQTIWKDTGRVRNHPDGQLRVSGAFDANDTQGFAKALADIYGFTVARRADGGLEIAAPVRQVGGFRLGLRQCKRAMRLVA